MSAILCIDPGPVTSGVVVLDDETDLPRVCFHQAKCPNESARVLLAWHCGEVVMERFACMGMAVGEETLEAVHWGGRFHQEAEARDLPVTRIKRHEVKMALCGNTRAKDANIRQAIIDLYGGPDAIKGPKKPTKTAPGREAGPLHGVSADAWAALAVGLTHLIAQRRSV
jgi:hypothetical protein